MTIRFLLLLIMLFVGTGARVAHKETTLAGPRAMSSADSIKKRKPQSLQRIQKQAINRARPVWRGVGKVLLYIVIVLAAIYLLVLLVVLALTSGMGK